MKKTEVSPRRDLRPAYLIFGFISFLILAALIVFSLVVYVITRPIEVGGTIECNSGKIGVDYQSMYNSTLIKSNITLLNETYIHSEEVGWTPKAFNLKGIDNLSCKMQFNSKSQLSNLIIFVWRSR